METILLVDDDQVILDVLRLGLEGYGYRVLVAGSNAEAWGKLEREPDRIDLVLLDAALPDVEDGATLAARMRAHSRLAPVPIVFLSGYDGPLDRARAFSAGADDFIAKPCRTADLVPRLRLHLKRRAWHRRVDESLARVQDVERTRDELLAIVVHEVGGLVDAVDAQLRQALAPDRLQGPGVDDVVRARNYARDVTRMVDDIRARYGWRKVDVLETPPEGIGQKKPAP